MAHDSVEASFIVVSDIHASSANRHKELRTSSEPPKFVTKYFGLQSLRDSIAAVIEGIPPERCVLLCAGDLTDQCLSSELRLAAKFLRDLADELQIPQNHRYLVPGNHDVDWRLTKLSEEDNWYDQHRQAKFAALLRESGFKFTRDGRPARFDLFDGRISLFLVDSPFEDRHSTKPHHGTVGKTQLDALRRLLSETPANAVRIVLLHHHITPLGRAHDAPDYSLVVDAREVQEVLKEGFVNLVIHGHQHRGGFEHLEGKLRPIAVLGAGSTTVPFEQLPITDAYNSFHIVMFDSLSGESACGMIHTRVFDHTKGWHPPRKSGNELPAARPFGHVFTPEDILRLTKQAIDQCNADAFIKLDDFLEAQPNGRYYSVVDFVDVLKHTLHNDGRDNDYEFLHSEDFSYCQMQLSRRTK